MLCLSNLEEALHEAEIVIEAIQEDMEAKRNLFESKILQRNNISKIPDHNDTWIFRSIKDVQASHDLGYQFIKNSNR